MQSGNQEVSAMVILKSRDEGFYLDPMWLQKQALPGDFVPGLSTVIESARFFRDSGFKVCPSPMTLRIKASAARFEEIFGIRISGPGRSDYQGRLLVPDKIRDVFVRLILNGDEPEYQVAC